MISEAPTKRRQQGQKAPENEDAHSLVSYLATRPAHDPTFLVRDASPRRMVLAPEVIRPAVEQILRRFEQRADAQQFGVAAKPADQLQADRQTVASEAAGQADRRMSGHVERHRPGKPVRANVVETSSVDVDGAEQILLDRQRGPRQGRHRQQIGALQQRLHAPEQEVRSNIACW